MKLKIKRTVTLFKCVRLQFAETNRIEAKYNMNGGLWLREITVSNDQNVVYKMKQQEWFKKIITIPFQFLIPPAYPEFFVYRHNELIGKRICNLLKFSQNKLQINDDIYETHLHSKNYMSIFKNGTQVALLQRGETIVCGSVDYNVMCDKSFSENKELLLLITAFLDIIYWRSTWYFASVQKRVTVGQEKFPEFVAWRPED